MAKKLLFKFLPLVFLLHSVCVGNLGDFRLFLHPLSLVSGITRNYDPNIYLTLQWNLNDKYDDNYHLIVNPFLVKRDDRFGIGSGMGFRYSMESRITYSGFYFQLMPNAYYSERLILDSDNVDKTVSGPVMNVLGYIGYSVATLWLFDAGIGYGWDYAKNSSGLVFDFNVSVEPLVCMAAVLLPIFSIIGLVL
jgi:hypothetical protein